MSLCPIKPNKQVVCPPPLYFWFLDHFTTHKNTPHLCEPHNGPPLPFFHGIHSNIQDLFRENNLIIFSKTYSITDSFIKGGEGRGGDSIYLHPKRRRKDPNLDGNKKGLKADRRTCKKKKKRANFLYIKVCTFFFFFLQGGGGNLGRWVVRI